MLETLAASVVAFLVPYVKKGAEKIIKKVGKKAEEKMGELLKTLKNRLSGDKEASDQIGYFEKDPDTYKPVLEKILQRRMSEDKNLADELAKLVEEIKEAAPNLEVYIKMDEGEDVTGIEADELTGSAKAELDIKKGKKITGAKIKRIGKNESEKLSNDSINQNKKKVEDLQSKPLDKVIDYREIIAKLTRGFVGRKWLRKEFDKFLNQEQKKCFLILGEPGSGKTAFLADLVVRRYYPHHFVASSYNFIGENSQLFVISSFEYYDPIRFAESIGYQLLRDYGGWIMDWEAWGISVDAKVKSSEGLIGASIEEFNAAPQLHKKPILSVRAELEKYKDHAYFIGVYIGQYNLPLERIVTQLLKVPLERIAKRWPKIDFVVAVDGLDEAKAFQDDQRNICNILKGIGLPSNIKFLLTSRPGDHIEDLLEHSKVFWLSENKEGKRDPRTIEDAKEYVRQLAEENDIKKMLEKRRLSITEFIDRVVDASDANFQYLHIYAEDLSAGNENLLNLENLPIGLKGIYKRFLRKTRKDLKNEKFWNDAYKPVLGALAVAKEPITLEQISKFSKIDKRAASTVVTNIPQFLDINEGVKDLHSIYQRSFSDYILSNDNKDYVGFKESNQAIVDYYMSEDGSCEDDYAKKYLMSHMIAAEAWSELKELSKDVNYLKQKKKQQFYFQDDIITLILNQEISNPTLVDIFEQILQTINKDFEDTKEKADWLDIFSYWLNEFGKCTDKKRWMELKKMANKFDHACGTLSRDLAIQFRNAGEDDWALRFAELATWVYQRANDLPKCVEACEFAVKLCQDNRVNEAYRILGKPEFLRMRARALNILSKTGIASMKERYESESMKAYEELNDAIKFGNREGLELKVDEWQQLEEDNGEVLSRTFTNNKPVRAQIVSNVHDCISALYIIQTLMKNGIGVKWVHSKKFKSIDLAPPDIKYTILIGGPKSPGISEVAQKFFRENKKGFLELYSAERMVAKVLPIQEGKTHCYMIGGPSKINTLKASYDFANDQKNFESSL